MAFRSDRDRYEQHDPAREHERRSLSSGAVHGAGSYVGSSEQRDRDERFGRQLDRQDDDDRSGRYEESRSVWRGHRGEMNVPNRYTDEDEVDRQTRGIRGGDNRSRQFASSNREIGDDMRGQFRRSRDDGELGRRGQVHQGHQRQEGDR